MANRRGTPCAAGADVALLPAVTPGDGITPGLPQLLPATSGKVALPSAYTTHWEGLTWWDMILRMTVSGAADSAGSLAKTFQILDLFTEAEPVWSTAAIIEALETSRSTGYRYIKALHDAGLLTSVRNGYYSLGPRIIEMDLQIRLTDPLLLASHGVLEELVEKIGHSALLCTAYRDSVLCIGECRAPHSPVNRFSRGQRRPLFQGAVSKVILAHLPHHRLKAIYARQSEEVARAGLGSTWSAFRANLGQIKRDGHLLTLGEFNPGVYGVAAPVLSPQKTALGSVGVAWDASQRRDVEVEDAVLAVTQAAATIAERLSEAESGRSGRQTA